MSNSKTLSELKELAYEMIDNNGNFRTVPLGVVGSRNLSTNRIHILQTLLSLLKDTSILSKETKVYVFDHYISIKGVNRYLNDHREKGTDEINFNTTMSKISYDRAKLERTFGKSIISDIILKTNNDEIVNNHLEKIIEAVVKYGRQSGNLRDSIALELDKNSLCVKLDADRFEQFKSTIMPYLKSHMQMISDNIDKESVGYFNYLLYSPVLSEVDTQRLEELKQILDPSSFEDEHVEIEY